MSRPESAYPLTWPLGMRRTKGDSQRRFPGKMPGEKVKAELMNEIKLLGGRKVLISSNVPVRQDGMPYADASRRIMRDPGVAVYFDLKGKEMCFACDRWDTVDGNLRAIGLTIAALRGMERWGSSDMVERAFTGYQALTYAGPPKKTWREVMGFNDEPLTMEVVREMYNAYAKRFHPDQPGGDAERMKELNEAFAQAKAELME